ncbi:hypothetical protein [Cytobacillus praedii]|uniref:hypothetical protein n=1 Tax=Cytobacillus praedii TaxID=1742358 RepID=UPI0007110086|nr:hypothetical protein [Cytobacillus praedii]MED3573283.1 hypothetical protein [Cytobacillus praedii]
MPRENFLRSVANMEQALANALNEVSGNPDVTPEQLSRILRLIIKKEIVLEFLLEDVFPPTPPAECDCQTSNEAGNNFNINRGTGAANTTVTFNGTTLPSNAHGSVTYNGHTCEDCMSDNEFTFTYGGSATVPAFTFTATTFNVPDCPGNIVEITGQGTTDNPQLFGPNPMYTLNLNGVMNNKTITVVITGNNNTFVATTTQLGNGELVVEDCPTP